MLLLAACGGGSGADEPRDAARSTGSGFANPVWDDNFPDPFVLRVASGYYAYGTNGPQGNVPVLRSHDLVHWKPAGDALPELGSWAMTGKTWAPEVLRRRDGRFVLLYTASSVDPPTQCIGRAVADAPGGPFVDRSPKPLVCQPAEGGSIDASPYAAGRALYLLWKNDGNSIGGDTFIYAQRLTPDALRLVGSPSRLVHQDAPWEGELVEAPTLWREDGRLFLFFSANKYYDRTYAVGYATCRTPLGPCTDAPENPILRTACNAVGPGHQSIVRDDDGDAWLVYHAWPPDAVGSESPGRVLWLDRLVFRDGRPEVRGPTCGRQPLP